MGAFAELLKVHFGEGMSNSKPYTQADKEEELKLQRQNLEDIINNESLPIKVRKKAYNDLHLLECKVHKNA